MTVENLIGSLVFIVVVGGLFLATWISVRNTKLR
jgi:hypothetical protein